MLENCRICGKSTINTNAKNLFEAEHQLFVHHIELLTGEWLEFDSSLPPYICNCCEKDLEVAAAFRERCIRTQKFYQQHLKIYETDTMNMAMVKKKNLIKIMANVNAEIIPSEEEFEYEYDRQQQMDDLKYEYLFVDENSQNTDRSELDEVEENLKEENTSDEEYDKISYDIDGKDMISNHYEDSSHDKFNNNIIFLRETLQDNKSTSDVAEVAFTRNINRIESNNYEGGSFDAFDNEINFSCQTLENNKSTSDAAKVTYERINRIQEQNLKSDTKRKYISWKQLNDEEKRELKRLRRKRDCVCDQCGRRFTDPSNLKLHLIRHTGVKNYECEVCNFKFYTAHLLKRHSIIHANTPPTFACQYCDRKFIYNNFRLKHERSHFKERRFQCTYCEKSFYSKTQQKEHELVHTRIRKYNCEVCNQHFLRRTHLRAHYRSKIHKSMEQQKV